MTEAEIENIKNDYLQGMKYKEIIDKYDITQPELRSIIRKNKLTRSKSEIQKGNQNAIGNSGGHGTEGNKNAVTTGEYEKLLLTAEEKQIYDGLVIIDKKTCIESEYKLLCIREFRILKRIKAIQDKEKDMNIERIVKRQYNSTNSNELETVTEATNVINPLQKLEDSLTRIQEAKRRCLDSMHKFETDDRRLELDIIRLEIEAARDDATNTEDIKDDSFIKALNGATEEVWNDYTEDD